MTDLEAFLQRVERLRAEELLVRTARPTDEAAHASAVAAAAEAARFSGRDRAVQDARRTIDEWVIGLFNRSTVQPGWYEANWGRPGTTEDRANLAHSLGEAVTALLLADRLDPGDRDELLGAWADLVPAR
jgi:hypothetical protein